MNNKFDELAKAMARPIARRAALKRFVVGIGVLALTALGMSNNALAGKHVKLGGIGDPCPCRKGLVCRIVGLRAICTQAEGIG